MSTKRKEDHYRIHDRGAAALPGGDRGFHGRAAITCGWPASASVSSSAAAPWRGAQDRRGAVNVQGEKQMKLDVIVQRHLSAHQRIRRQSGRHGVRGARGAVSRFPRNTDAASICWHSIRSTARATSTSMRRSAAFSRCSRPRNGAQPPTPDGLSAARMRSSCARATRSTARRPCWS